MSAPRRSLLERRFEDKLVKQLDDLDAVEQGKNGPAPTWIAKDRVALFEVVADYLAAQAKRGGIGTWGEALKGGSDDR